MLAPETPRSSAERKLTESPARALASRRLSPFAWRRRRSGRPSIRRSVVRRERLAEDASDAGRVEPIDLPQPPDTAQVVEIGLVVDSVASATCRAHQPWRSQSRRADAETPTRRAASPMR